MKRIVTTPQGMSELDIAGSKRYIFITLTVFGQDGWSVREEMWSSHQGVSEEPLGAFLNRHTGLAEAQAASAAHDVLAEWERRGGPNQGAHLTRRVGLGVISALLGVAILVVLLTVALMVLLDWA